MKAGHDIRWAKFGALALFAAALLTGIPRGARAEATPPAAVERLYRAGRYEQAVEQLQAAVGKNPGDGSLHFWLGRSFFELRDFSRAVASLEKATTIEPANSQYHHWLGRACGRKAEESNPFSALGLARRTHREFESAVRLDSSNLGAQRDLIRYLLLAPGIVGGGK